MSGLDGIHEHAIRAGAVAVMDRTFGMDDLPEVIEEFASAIF